MSPASVVDTASDSPFIILFYAEDQDEEDGEEKEREDVTHSRRKRFAEIKPDLEEDHVRKNYYEHDDMDEIETEIVTFDRKNENEKEDGEFLDEDGNGVKDIDEEA